MTTTPMKDFFISYNKADRPWAEWIAWQLEEENYTTVLQAWDFRPGSNFVLDMQQATAQAARTIAVLSPDYLDAKFTQPEWAAAFAQDGTGEQGTLLPVRVRECELKGLLKQIVYIDLFGVQETAAKNTLLAGVRKGRAKPTTEPLFPGTSQRPVIKKPRFPGTLPPIWNIPHNRNLNFTGRQDFLSELRSAFTSGQSTLIQAIHGLGGVGKTQTAVEYAYRYSGEYEIVWWVRSEEEATLVADYTALAAHLRDVPEKDAGERDDIERAEHKGNVRAVRNWLARTLGWLLIFDNVRDPDNIRDYLPQGNTGHVIVTSRHANWDDVAGALNVKALRRDEAVQFLLRRTRQNDAKTATRIAEALGCLPLALEQAAAYIRETGRTLAYYLGLLKPYWSELMQDSTTLTDYQATVATTWNISFQQVKQTSPAGEDLMNLCAFFAPDAMPLEVISRGKRFIPKPLAATVADPLAFNKSIATLRRYSLAEVGNDAATFHLLVQAVWRERLNEDARKLWAEAAVSIVDAAFPSVNDDKARSTCETLLPHALATTTYAGELQVAKVATSKLLNRLGLYMQGRAEFAKAKPTLEKALAIAEAIYGLNHPNVASHLNNLGGVLQDLGDLKGARKLYERAVAIDEASDPPDYSRLTIRFNNLGDVLRELGDLEGAKIYLNRALTIAESLHGSDHPKVARRLSNLGVVLYAQGDLIGARTLFERAMKINKAVYGDSHRAVARDFSNLGNVLQDQGDIAGARSHYERALKIFSGLLGEEHPSTVKARNNLASLDSERDKSPPTTS